MISWIFWWWDFMYHYTAFLNEIVHIRELHCHVYNIHYLLQLENHDRSIGGGDYPNIWLNKWWSGKVFNSQNSNHTYTLHQEWYAYFYCFGVGFFCVNGQLSRTMNFREEVVILYFWYWKKKPTGLQWQIFMRRICSWMFMACIITWLNVVV